MLNESECWQAVLERDARSRARFVYAVRTTGVYCRPGCASRRPRRDNVQFFEEPEAAEAAGYRACKRCRPADPSAATRHLRAIEKACRIIVEAETMPSLQQLADAAGLSRFHFHRLFRQVVGATPREYAQARRADRLAHNLASGQNVTQAILDSGYGSSARAYAACESMTPGARRDGGRGEAIGYTVISSTIGQVLVAATAKGLCAVELGDEPETLVRALQERFPTARVAEDRGRLRDWAQRVVRYIADPHARFELPLDIRGTAFQASVWRTLRKIPVGRTASYAEIAAALGRPTAVRAVAQACGANPLAVLIPCHRVVRSDGGLGGYRWGVARKRALLRRETERPGTEKTKHLAPGGER